MWMVMFSQVCNLSLKQLQKLHHVFGHTKIDKLEKLIKVAGKATDEAMEQAFLTVIPVW